MENTYEAENQISDIPFRVFLKTALALALPIAAQRIAGVFVNLLDNLMVGSLGDVSVAACSVANQFFLLYSCISTGAIGGGLLISTQAWGKQDASTVKKMISAGLLICTVVAIAFFGVTFAWGEQIIAIYTNERALFLPGADYLRIIAWSYLPFALTTVLTMLLRTVGTVKLGFYVECINSAVNAFFNWVLIFGKLGFPAMGLRGAAIASVISRFVGLAVTVYYVARVENKLKYRLKDLMELPDRSLWAVYAKCGIPMLFTDTLMMLNSVFQTMITGRISDVYITANSIIHVIWQIAILTGMGFETAANIMIGNDIGSGNLQRAQKTGEQFFLLSILQGAVSAVIVLLIGPFILRFYHVSEAALETAGTMIWSASLVVFIMAIQMVTTKGVIRAGGKTRQLLAVDLLSTFGFGLPLGYLAAFHLHLPPYLIYVIIRGDYLIKAIWGIVKLKKKTWVERLI